MLYLHFTLQPLLPLPWHSPPKQTLYQCLLPVYCSYLLPSRSFAQGNTNRDRIPTPSAFDCMCVAKLKMVIWHLGSALQLSYGNCPYVLSHRVLQPQPEGSCLGETIPAVPHSSPPQRQMLHHL